MSERNIERNTTGAPALEKSAKYPQLLGDTGVLL